MKGKREGEDELTVPRPEGQGSPLQRSEPKPRAAIEDIQANRGLTRQSLAFALECQWRRSRSLGWVTFKARAAQWQNGQVKFARHYFKVWDSYGMAGYKFRAGSFCEYSRGHW